MAIYINRNAPESGIASLLALQGTKGDTELVHMTKPEVKLLANTGLMSMNKETGLPQFAKGGGILKSLIPMIAGVAFPALLGPSIAGALGSSALVGNAIAGGLGTAFGGIITGEDPAEALTKGLIGGGLTYGLGSAFPETFGYGKAPEAGGTGGMPQTSAGYNRMREAYSPPTIGEFSGEMPLEMRYRAPTVVHNTIPIYPGSEGQFRSRSLYSGFPQRMSTPEEAINLTEDLNTAIMTDRNRPIGQEFSLYDKGEVTAIYPDSAKMRELGLEFGLPQKYGTYSAEEISNLPSSLRAAEMRFRAPTVGDNTITDTVTETSMLDGFKDRLFDKTSLASLAGAAGAGLLVPEEQEEVKLEEREEYVPRELDYVFKRKRPSFIDGLTPRQISELYQRGGIDRRFYEGTGRGKDVYRPIAAQEGGGIEDLISISEQVGISQTPFEGKIPGQGHGMEDNVVMPILDRGGVAAVSPKEYVVPADVMAMIGNGNADDGAKEMDSFIEDFRMVKYGRPTQPPEMNGRSALQSLMKT
jgi:hypothetical protein